MSSGQPSTETFAIGPLQLEGGRRLPAVDVAYELYGHLSPAADNAILLCHGLTGSARAGCDGGWWAPLIGRGAAFDTNRYAVISTNVLGGCYGTTGPRSIDPETGQRYASRFPRVTVGDMVEVQARLLQGLGVRSLVTVAGGSLGGLQVLEWAARYPTMAQSIIPIAASLGHSAWCIGFNEAARQAIRSDPDFHDGEYEAHGTAPQRGLALARMIAMLSYRSSVSFEERFGRQTGEESGGSAADFAIASYLRYQGDRLVQRFDANSYLRITEAMDSFDVGDGRGGHESALAPFRGSACVVGIDSDVLYPTWHQRKICNVLNRNGNATVYHEIATIHGHDAFLMEWTQLTEIISTFLGSLNPRARPTT